jgi:hypothetical protein
VKAPKPEGGKFQSLKRYQIFLQAKFTGPRYPAKELQKQHNKSQHETNSRVLVLAALLLLAYP